MNLHLRKSWTTHMAMLIKTVQLSDGPILELGGGVYSTPLLHWLCAEKRRTLVTYEDDPNFFNFLKSFRTRTHRVRLIENWTTIDTKTHWSVALVDHGIPINRINDVLLLKDCVDYIVVHDATEMKDHEVWSTFKYKYLWSWCYPNTMVVSNFKDLSNL